MRYGKFDSDDVVREVSTGRRGVVTATWYTAFLANPYGLGPVDVAWDDGRRARYRDEELDSDSEWPDRRYNDLQQKAREGLEAINELYRSYPDRFAATYAELKSALNG